MVNFEDIEKEIEFKTARSSGAGGQHVNKVNTKIQVYWHVMQSSLLTDEQKKLLSLRLANKINKDGYLVLSAQSTRSQYQNKELAVQKLKDLVYHALKSKKKRKKTKLSKQAKEKRLKLKRIQSDKKQQRKNIKW